VISELICDGVIVATPTGSTAYSMSAGGPIVEPAAKNFVITPICAHAYYGGSIVLSSERLIRITLGDLENRAAYLSMDGAESFHLESFDRVCVRISKHHTELVNLKDNSFYDILRAKLSNV
jgi:NAD+ kinase